ncbi:MAG: GDP-L-fucose synthase [Nevskiales bacterium]
MQANDRIYVAGHRGLVGAALLRRLQAEGFGNLLLKTHTELELRQQSAVESFFEQAKPQVVFLAAAHVGGIGANSHYPGEFIYDNLAIQTNVIHAAWKSGVKKLVFLGSSCIYPKLAPQPMPESALLTGPLEPTNEWYAIAKIAGIKLCQAYRRQYGFDAISLMPTNVYGPGDNFHLENSHVVPALLRKFHEARQSAAPQVVIWGSGTPRREFIHVDDLADATVFLAQRYSGEEWVNVGTAQEVSIRELAELVASVVGYRGRIVQDPAQPDGAPRKLLDSRRLAGLGWRSRIGLEQGLTDTYRWYVAQRGGLRT